MISLFTGILVDDKSYHINCLTDEEIFKIYADGKYIQFSRHENYASKIYPHIDETYVCMKCGKVIE